MAAASLLSLSLPKPTIIIPKSSASTITPTVTVTEPLEQKFGRKGIKFTEYEGGQTAELSVRNGSSVKIQLNNAHVTSYKPKVYWKDDGCEEVLYTTSSGDKGGIGLVIDSVTDDTKGKSVAKGVNDTKGKSVAKGVDLSQWVVKDADSDSIDAVQVELSCTTSGTLDITYVISLYALSMATAVIVKNKGRKPVNLKTGILSHLRFKKRGGTAIDGLKGSSYCTHPPLSSPFEILSPSEALKPEDPGLFSFGWEPEKKVGVWSKQDVPITILKHKLSRVYGTPLEERLKEFYNTIPSKYETLDQGRELFFRVIRMGFEEIYLSSPGSLSEKYGNDYFICTGPVSVLSPITIEPGEEWRGAQVIEHDNL
ncbi:NDH-dependent cyclic electron flow 1 [Artemisia annua]|uniref:NDH-dependent cyclic electron flow 1 n=1 Tax=Artemisia annua TaxID=35608 RepID=A0A2U1L931_ARTAN|nr:NDH-dependent cyclic electron flow 1 [Artemisia annua]